MINNDDKQKIEQITDEEIMLAHPYVYLDSLGRHRFQYKAFLKDYPIYTEYRAKKMASELIRLSDLALNQKKQENSEIYEDNSEDFVEESVKPQNKSEKRQGLEYRTEGIAINWSNRTIITDLGQDYDTYICSFDRHRAIVQAYSNQYEGKSENQEEIARRFDFSNAHAVARYVKAHGIRHTSPPISDFDLLEVDDKESLIDKTLENTLSSLKRSFHKKLEKRKWSDTVAAAEKYWFLESEVLEPLITSLREIVPSYQVPEIKLNKSEEPYIVMTGPQDWHFGKEAKSIKGQDLYNKKIAEKTLKKSTDKIINNIMKQGKPEWIGLILGSDDLHIDTLTLTTTAGTSQATQTDGNYDNSLIDGYVNNLLYLVNTYKAISDVRVYIVPGNHNRLTALIVGKLLEVVFENDKKVSIVRSDYPRIYDIYGTTGIMLLHGDGWSDQSLKSNVHKLCMVEAREMGFPTNKIENWLVITGDKHTLKEFDYGGVEVVTVPSLSPPDSWHAEKAYVGNRKLQSAYLVGEESGRFGTFLG